MTPDRLPDRLPGHLPTAHAVPRAPRRPPLGIALLGCLHACLALAAPQAPATAQPALQPVQALQEFARQFLQAEAAGLPGKVTVSANAVDARLHLPACTTLQGFLPAGSRVWGRTTVGVRCTAPSPWTIYVPARVQVEATYYLSAAPLAQGQVIAEADLAAAEGDLAALPAGVITEPKQALGRSLLSSVTAGTPLRQDLLRSQPAVLQGQVVRIVAGGAGFSVSTDGRALTAAADGQLVQARTAGGQVVSGVARNGGIVMLGH